MNAGEKEHSQLLNDERSGIHNFPLIDLTQIERAAFRSYFRDGLWDLAIGILLLALAVSISLSDAGVSPALRVVVSVPLMLFAPVLLILGKRYLTVPRIGKVNFGTERSNKLMQIHKVIAAAVVVTLALLAQAVSSWHPRGVAGDYGGDVIVAGMVVTIFSTMAYNMDFPRLHIYGFLFGFSFPAFVFLDLNTGLPPAIPFAVCGCTAALIGGKMLLSFMQEVPVSTDTDHDPSADTGEEEESCDRC